MSQNTTKIVSGTMSCPKLHGTGWGNLMEEICCTSPELAEDCLNTGRQPVRAVARTPGAPEASSGTADIGRLAFGDRGAVQLQHRPHCRDVTGPYRTDQPRLPIIGRRGRVATCRYECKDSLLVSSSVCLHQMMIEIPARPFEPMARTYARRIVSIAVNPWAPVFVLTNLTT